MQGCCTRARAAKHTGAASFPAWWRPPATGRAAKPTVVSSVSRESSSDIPRPAPFSPSRPSHLYIESFIPLTLMAIPTVACTNSPSLSHSWSLFHFHPFLDFAFTPIFPSPSFFRLLVTLSLSRDLTPHTPLSRKFLPSLVEANQRILTLRWK